MKTCIKCSKSLPYESFYRRRSKPDGRMSECIRCWKLYSKSLVPIYRERRRLRKIKWRRNNPEEARRRDREWKRLHPQSASLTSKRVRLKRFGLSEQSFLSAHLDRDGLCDICRRQCYNGPSHTLKDKCDLHVDHCHKTGEFRGLLCMNCNVGIGHLNDDPILLIVASEYLKRHGLRLVKI